MVETLRDQVRYCNEPLDTPREVLGEHRRFVAGLIDRVLGLEASVEPPASFQIREEPAQEHDAGPCPAICLPLAGGETP